MSTQVQFRRGTTAQTATFTGASAELTVDTTKNTIVVHDGSTAGGFALARESALSSNATFAQAAFTQANAAFLQANTPSYTANSAASYANSAFVAANSAGVGLLMWRDIPAKSKGYFFIVNSWWEWINHRFRCRWWINGNRC